MSVPFFRFSLRTQLPRIELILRLLCVQAQILRAGSDQELFSSFISSEFRDQSQSTPLGRLGRGLRAGAGAPVAGSGKAVVGGGVTEADVLTLALRCDLLMTYQRGWEKGKAAFEGKAGREGKQALLVGLAQESLRSLLFGTGSVINPLTIPGSLALCLACLTALLPSDRADDVLTESVEAMLGIFHRLSTLVLSDLESLTPTHFQTPTATLLEAYQTSLAESLGGEEGLAGEDEDGGGGAGGGGWVEPSPDLVAQLEQMGFDRNGARRAAVMTVLTPMNVLRA